MQSKFSPKLFLTRAGLVVALGVTGAACAQTWNYRGSMKHDAPGPAVLGQMTLEEVGGEYKFQMRQEHYTACYKSPMKASVERTPSTITITPTPIIRGCAQTRFVLNTDGTSGVREFFNGGQWRRDEAFRLVAK